MLGILNFDAHFDLRPYEKGTGTSGTMFRQIADYTREKGTEYAYYVMGIQKHSNTLSLFRLLKTLGLSMYLVRT